ncbi:MAG: Ig-like domain-containing protein, partial [Anaerolineales bacterium]|nr:Ig-like domain-containing protein [Anaerolineales bacterium]
NLSKHTFIAKISGIDIDDVTSGELTVLSEENDSKMTVEIVNPACGSVYNVTDDFNITVNADDADDVINGTLIINGVLIENFSNGETIFNYSFVYDGNHQIVVETVNNRGDIANDFVNVIAIDPAKSGDYVAACIDEPADASNVGTGAVYFNAASSKGIRYTASSSNIEIVDLPSSDLRLDWLFSNTLENPYHDGSHVNSYSFTANFVDAGNNWATLEVSLL